MSASLASNRPLSISQQLFVRHEFAIRRVHSLLGIVPLGLYMVVHLTTNASLLNGAETFQRAVFLIHSPGQLLPLIEWGAIFLPLLFHAVIGVWISKTGRFNSDRYKLPSNRRYVWQRITGIIALVYLFLHILHLHGWFHVDFYHAAIYSVGLGQFAPYNAASTLANALQGWVWPPIYLIGMLACVYHLANGLWTAGITWGLWISPTAQARASKLAVAFGVVLAVIGTSAWYAAVAPDEADIAEFKQAEDRMYDVAVEAGMVPEMPKKRAGYHELKSTQVDAESRANASGDGSVVR
ncbi:MAG: succinate dehydrogenase cytochrome b558 subunit [Planctomycetota bacterium]